MTFKDWLISESGGSGEGHGSSFFYGLQLYPSDAFDYSWANDNPAEISFLQRRWQIERKQGRKFHNIDEPNFQKTSFISIEDNDGTPKIVKHKNLINLAIGKNSTDVRELKKSNKPISVDLDSLFKDKGTNSTQEESSDEPWKRIYENLFNYNIIGNSSDGIKNSNMGIRSKYIGPDETGENDSDGKEIKIADFGFNKRNKKKYMKKHK